MTVDWLQAQLQARSDLSFWLGVSMLLHFFCANLSWLFSRILRSVDDPGSRLWRTRAGWPWLVDFLRWGYMIGLPYLLLVSGILSPIHIGLVELDWVGTLRRVGILAPATLIILLIAWWTYLRGGSKRRSVDRGWTREPLAIVCVTSLAETAALQLHWAFYRASAATLPWVSDSYWAAWLGVLLILLQWGLNPWVWRSLRNADGAEDSVRRGALLIVSTALFLMCGNLWLCWLVHAAFECCARRMSNSPRANGEE